MIRAFVALPIPEAARAVLGPFLEQCARCAPGLRWVPAENLHLTLRFLGDIDEQVAGRLADRLGTIRAAPFTLRTGALGSFGGTRSPRVVWLGLEEGASQAQGLAELCEAACRELGLDAEARPFRPHLTLARARDREPPPLPRLPPAPAIEPWTAGEFVLYRSQLGRGPARYTPVRRFPLTGR